jgi:hypothetical protein
LNPPASVPTVPLAKVIAGALLLSWERRHALLHALWLPLLLGVAFTVSETIWGPTSWERGGTGEDADESGLLLLWTVPLFVLTVVFAVRSYRVYLLHKDAQQVFAPFSWGLRETRFIFAMAGLAFIFAAAAFLFGSLVTVTWPDVNQFAGGRFGLLLLLPPAYLAGRMLLAFPMIATDAVPDVFQALGMSWAMTRRNGWRVLALCFLLPGAIAWGLEQMSQLALPGVALISAAAVWLVMPVELALVALCYVSLRPDSCAAPPSLH